MTFIEAIFCLGLGSAGTGLITLIMAGAAAPMTMRNHLIAAAPFCLSLFTVFLAGVIK